MKSVQISRELFFNLVKYHLVGMDDVLPDIQKGLNEKMEAMLNHKIYTEYKAAPTKEERERARQKYLDYCGIPDSFRW